MNAFCGAEMRALWYIARGAKSERDNIANKRVADTFTAALHSIRLHVRVY